MDDNLIVWLQNWYYSNCDGDWEHGYGVKIGTLDNPGWSIDINLEETDMENMVFENISIERAETDWIFCKVEHIRFKGACGPLNLLEMLEIFRSWVRGVSINGTENRVKEN